MNDSNDDTQTLALMVLAGVVALVIAGVLGLAVHTGTATAGARKGTAGASAGATAGVTGGVKTGVTAGAATGETTGERAAAAVVAGVTGAADGRIYFEPGSAALPPAASAALVQLADAARSDSARVVRIAGFHAAGGADADPALANRRAFAVRHALEANGVAPDRLRVEPPVAAPAGAASREAHRVEVRLR